MLIESWKLDCWESVSLEDVTSRRSTHKVFIAKDDVLKLSVVAKLQAFS